MVTAKSLFDKKVYSDYYWHDQLSSGKVIPAVLGSLIVAGIGVYYTLTARTAYSIVMYALALLIIISYVVRVFSIIKRNVGTFKLDKQPYTVLIEITDKKIHTRDSRSNKDVTFRWSDIKRTCETGKYFFFHINKKQAVVLRKSDITEGSKEDIVKWAAAAKAAARSAKKKK